MRTAALSLSSLLLFLCLTPGCPKPVGECQYGEAGSETRTGTIIEVSPAQQGTELGYLVRVDDDGPREFWLSEELHQTCMVEAGREVGSEVPIIVEFGGPCPPMFYIEGCR